MTGMDWKEALDQLRQDPSLPPGETEASDGCKPDNGTKRPADILRVLIDKKGRKGKTATIIEGFSCDETELQEIASRLKKKLGAGGSARGGEILIQGDYKVKVTDLLREAGYKVR